ncbi:MAG: hypothetical protein AAF849_24620 [Bacteroidota bacterium]
MQERIQKKDRIHVTAKIYKEENLYLLMQALNDIQDLLNLHININEYGKGVDFIGFIFVLEPAARDFHPNYLHYSKTHKELTLQYRLPYEQLQTASSEEVFSTLIEYFLKALDTYHQADAAALNEASDDIEDFDFTAWKVDVERWFEAEGWMAAVS